MNSTLKMVGPIVLVVLVVFGATLISQYTTTEKKPTVDPAQIVGQPLEFRSTEMAYNPAAEDVSARAFDAFHEPGGEPVYVSFWFKNPVPVPVRFTVVGRSCSSCTAASAAVVPPGAVEALARQAAAGLFPPTALPLPDLLTPAAAAALDRGLTWQPLDFDNPGKMVEIPAANGDEPTLGIFRMHITVSAEGPKTLHAAVGMAAGDQPPANLAFKVSLYAVPPLQIHPREVKLGDLPEGTATRSFDVFCWSATRGPADLSRPAVAVADRDPLVQVGEPVPLSPEEADRLAVRLVGEGWATRVRAAYRVPVTVNRHFPAAGGGPTEPDVGPFERRVGFAGPNGSSATLTVSGTVTGVVGLDGGLGRVALGSFNARAGTRKTLTLSSDRADVELAVAAGEHQPAYLTAELGPPTAEGGRRYWPLTVTVPGGAGSGPMPADAHVTLRATGPNRDQKVRIPVTGQGVTR